MDDLYGLVVPSCPLCNHEEHPNEVCGHWMRLSTPRADGETHKACDCATGSAVIEQISKEVKAGDAPIYTRNDMVRFLTWYNERTADGDFLFATEEENKQAVEEFVRTIGGE